MLALDFSDLPGQNETAQEAKPPTCQRCTLPPKWRVMSRGKEVTLVCNAHKHDFLFRKGGRYLPPPGMKFERYVGDDKPPFRGKGGLYQFTGAEMRGYTSRMAKQGKPVVFERRIEGPRIYYVAKGVTKKDMKKA